MSGAESAASAPRRRRRRCSSRACSAGRNSDWPIRPAGRRRKVGWDLYCLLDIKKGEREKTFRQHNRNFTFFGAPVGLFFFVERHMRTGAWLDVGMFLEAVMAAAQFGLDNLTLIIDHNRLQQGARLADTNDLAPIVPKLEAFGWTVREIDGHDMEAIVEALSPETQMPGKPTCVVAHTNKGQGISFMQDRVEWHHKVPNREQYEQAMRELGEMSA